MSAYYIYALKDPRERVPKPFYIGKGTGIRAWQHDLKPDKTAKLGLKLLKEAVLEFSKANKEGISNSEIVKNLGLQSDYLGGSKDYLSWSLLGLLMREGKMSRKKDSRKHIANK